MSRPVAGLAAFVLVAAMYAAFKLSGWEGDFPEGVLKVALWVVPSMLAIRLAWGLSYRGVLEELGLARGLFAGYLFGIVGAIPMVAAFSRQTAHVPGPATLIGPVLLGPLAEEVLFRGFLFRQLYRRAGWPVRTALLASGLAFGLAHFANVRITDNRSMILAIGEVGTTALGGFLFAWIVYRWDSLWPAIGLHTFMNLSWEVFGVEDWASEAQSGATAVGTGLANVARLASVLLAVYLTIRLRRSRKRELHHGAHGGFPSTSS